ncbi:MAG: hypothetical protein ABH919_01785 [bacterium]
MKTTNKTTPKTKIGILGYGEVGRAIAKFYKNPKIKDLNRDDRLNNVEVLHICVPGNNNFIEIAKKEIKEINPKLTIIHSTVEPFTTKKLIQSLPFKNRAIVHSPIRGIHPHPYKGIKIFVKYIGAENEATGKLAKKHLESIGLKTKMFTPAVTTEIGKLFSTSYYGICIAWHREMKKICDKTKVDFEKAVTDFNKTYNEGYIKLGKKNVVRPVLYPPKGKIGGHCVVPNAKILKQYSKNNIFDFIIE